MIFRDQQTNRPTAVVDNYIKSLWNSKLTCWKLKTARPTSDQQNQRLLTNTTNNGSTAPTNTTNSDQQPTNSDQQKSARPTTPYIYIFIWKWYIYYFIGSAACWSLLVCWSVGRILHENFSFQTRKIRLTLSVKKGVRGIFPIILRMQYILRGRKKCLLAPFRPRRVFSEKCFRMGDWEWKNGSNILVIKKKWVYL